jgi:hypothetical protein
MKIRHLLTLLCACVTLTGCPQFPDEQIDFINDPYILRGQWQGSIEPSLQTVPFELSATYVDKSRYDIIGTTTLGSDVVFTISGTVTGFKRTFIFPQTTVPTPSEYLVAQIASSDGKTAYELCVSSSGTRGGELGIIYVGYLDSTVSSPLCSEKTESTSRQINLQKAP